MAWKPRAPEIEMAMNIGKMFHKDQVIILMINSRTGMMKGASWGKTKQLCNETDRLMDIAYDAVEADHD